VAADLGLFDAEFFCAPAKDNSWCRSRRFRQCQRAAWTVRSHTIASRDATAVAIRQRVYATAVTIRS